VTRSVEVTKRCAVCGQPGTLKEHIEKLERALRHIAYEPLTSNPEASAGACLDEATRIAREALRK